MDCLPRASWQCGAMASVDRRGGINVLPCLISAAFFSDDLIFRHRKLPTKPGRYPHPPAQPAGPFSFNFGAAASRGLCDGSDVPPISMPASSAASRKAWRASSGGASPSSVNRRAKFGRRSGGPFCKPFDILAQPFFNSSSKWSSSVEPSSQSHARPYPCCRRRRPSARRSVSSPAPA